MIRKNKKEIRDDNEELITKNNQSHSNKGSSSSSSSSSSYQPTTILSSISNSIKELITFCYRPNNNPNREGELITKNNQLDSTFIFDWISILKRGISRDIIYFLLENNIAYLRGLDKILTAKYKTIRDTLSNLKDLGIIIKISDVDDEREIKTLHIHKKAFNLSDYHFKRATFYKLTKVARVFYQNFPYEILIGDKTRKKIIDYKHQLHKSHKQIEKEQVSKKNRLEEYFKQFKIYRDNILEYSHEKGLRWIEKRANELGVVSPEILLTKFENRFSDGKSNPISNNCDGKIAEEIAEETKEEKKEKKDSGNHWPDKCINCSKWVQPNNHLSDLGRCTEKNIPRRAGDPACGDFKPIGGKE